LVKKFSSVFVSSFFGHQNPGSGFDPDPYPDPYPDSLEMLNRDPYSRIRIHNSALKVKTGFSKARKIHG